MSTSKEQEALGNLLEGFVGSKHGQFQHEDVGKDRVLVFQMRAGMSYKRFKRLK
jgi:hypothetical protein